MLQLMKKLQINMPKSKAFFFIIFAIVFGFSLYFFRAYLSTAFLALIFAYMLQQPYRYFQTKRGWGTNLSTILTFSTFMLFILVPSLLVVNITIGQVVQFYTDLSAVNLPADLTVDRFLRQANDLLNQIPFVSYQLTEEVVFSTAQNVVEVLSTALRGQILAISNTSIRVVTDLVLFMIFVITFIPNVDKITKFITKLSPLSREVNTLYMYRITSMAVAMLRGSLVIAFIQAVATGLVLWLTGVPYVFFFAVITFFFCLVPLGSGLILIPAGAVFLLMGSWAKGIFLIASYFLFIGNIDNVVRPMLVSKDAMVHPVMMLVSVFAGLAAFGFWGFVYGPLVAILLITTLEVYEKEFAQ